MGFVDFASVGVLVRFVVLGVVWWPWCFAGLVFVYCVSWCFVARLCRLLGLGCMLVVWLAVFRLLCMVLADWLGWGWWYSGVCGCFCVILWVGDILVWWVFCGGCVLVVVVVLLFWLISWVWRWFSGLGGCCVVALLASV